MSKLKLMKHQITSLQLTKHKNRVAYFLDMGLGKTFIGSEKLKSFDSDYNLVVCQKSKLQDWENHFKTYYPDYNTIIYKSQKISELPKHTIIIINYDVVWKKLELTKLNEREFTLVLDESQYIKNKTSKRSKFFTRTISPSNVILLSGTPTGGKYEELWTQCKLLGWHISESRFYDDYMITQNLDVGRPYPIKQVVGYKNIELLKENLKQYGAIFMLTDEVLTLPEQIETIVSVDNIPEYMKFKKNKIIEIKGKELLGDTVLTELLQLRLLAGLYNKNKIEALRDIIESTEGSVVIFYNFRGECEKLKQLAYVLKREVFYINGDGNTLTTNEPKTNAMILVQYKSGSTGLNLQFTNIIIYYSPPFECDFFMQSKKRIHRIGQTKTCFYYYLVSKNSIEEKIYKTLDQRKNYTLELFNKENT